jgi:hypothetical protein
MENNISRCGLDCNACKIRVNVGCDGCRAMEEPYWDGVCEIKDCVVKLKKIDDCSYCSDFPCELLLDIALDPDTGDDGDRLERLKLIKELRDEKRTGDIRQVALGATIGTVAGFLIAAIIGGAFDWFVALAGGDYYSIPETPDSPWGLALVGALVGAAIPLIIKFIVRYNKNE